MEEGKKLDIHCYYLVRSWKSLANRDIEDSSGGGVGEMCGRITWQHWRHSLLWRPSRRWCPGYWRRALWACQVTIVSRMILKKRAFVINF